MNAVDPERPPDAPLVLYGSTASYYTGKLEAYLRAKGIPYRLEPFSESNMRRCARHTGVVQIRRVRWANWIQIQFDVGIRRAQGHRRERWLASQAAWMIDGDDAPSRQGRWLWALPFAYAIHIADEFLIGTGLWTWVGAIVPFSAGSFLGVNFMIISMIAVAVALARQTDSGRFLAVAVFTQFALHGLIVHPGWSLWAGHASPGLATGTFVLLPLAFAGFYGASSLLPRSHMIRGAVAGVLLFASQDLWRVIFNIFYPPSA